MPQYQWDCVQPSCGGRISQFISLAEIEARDLHPSAMKPSCPKCGNPTTYNWGGKLKIDMDFPLWDAGERYAAQVEHDEAHPEVPSYDRYQEAQERKQGERRIRREGAKIFV